MNNEQYIAGMLDRTLRCFDQDEVEKVRNPVFAVSGLGGVGAITVELLARWGVKKFRLLDMDEYETSNLNRQLFATSKTIGEKKVDVAERRILEINPYAEIEMKIPDRVDNENVDRFVANAGFVIQNADHPSCKLFYIAARKHKVPLVNGYATISGGRVQIFDFNKKPCTHFLEKLWHRFKYQGGKPIEEMTRKEIEEFDSQNVHPTAPSINFVVNTVGAMITGEAVKFITGRGKPVVYPKYRYFDLFDNKMKMRNSNSVFNPDNLKRLFNVIGSKF
jgi:tRNA A37 threonylcarbamoyladenosine dehydratase